jgi:hypothetical protein
MSESRIGRIKAIDLSFSENHMALEIALYYGGGLNQSVVMYLLTGKALMSAQDHVVPEGRLAKCLVDLHRFLGVTRLSDGVGQAVVAEIEAGRIVRLLRLPCDGDAVFLPEGYR